MKPTYRVICSSTRTFSYFEKCGIGKDQEKFGVTLLQVGLKTSYIVASRIENEVHCCK